MLSRRDLLKLGALGGAAGLFLRGQAFGAPFGTFPDDDLALPAGRQVHSVLEVFLYGGLSQWESLYTVPAFGASADPDEPGEQLHAFGGQGRHSVAEALERCGLPPDLRLAVPFGRDAAGTEVSLGPFAEPLRQRDDITGRMRILVQKHDLEPHEAAVPLALTGRPVGNPQAAGLGAHLQRAWLSRHGSRRSPYGYVLSTGGIAGDNVLSATATGAHSGAARPLRIKVDNAERLAKLLSRPGAGTAVERRQVDALLARYAARGGDQLRHGGVGDPLRSRALTDAAQAIEAARGVDGLADVLDPALFVPAMGEACGDDTSFDVPTMSFRLAAHLLTHPMEAARYVCVVDTGLVEASGGGGYDTHTRNSQDTARNLGHMLKLLTGIINEPGENDPRKLDLDRTLVILNTEFGRTPWRQDGGSGRNHHPWGYATAMCGGPIGVAERGIAGAIDANGVATSFVTPAENRIAALLAAGVYPFSPEAFGVSDVQGAGDEHEATRMVTERVLGVRS